MNKMKKNDLIHATHRMLNITFLGIISEIKDSNICINGEWLFVNDYKIEVL